MMLAFVGYCEYRPIENAWKYVVMMVQNIPCITVAEMFTFSCVYYFDNKSDGVVS
jgi:hypothetical protein